MTFGMEKLATELSEKMEFDDTFNAAAPRANQPSGYREFNAIAASLYKNEKI